MLERWRERDVFAESVRRRTGAPQWGFYEGPPTANGNPGTHHVLSRVFKDIFPRYRTMTGHYVERKGGWDTGRATGRSSLSSSASRAPRGVSPSLYTVLAPVSGTAPR